MRFEIRPGVRRAVRLPPFTREQAHAELDEELDSLVLHRVEHLVESGMNADEATQSAMRHLGSSIAEARTQLHKARPLRRTVGRRLESAIDSLTLHLQLTFRVMRRMPRFTALVVSTIAIGIGASAAIFSAVDAVVLRPLPFRDGHRLVSLWATNPDKSIPRYGVSYPDFRDWKLRARSFEDMALYVSSVAIVIGSGGPESVTSMHVTSNFLKLLGIEPVLGRGFGPDDERGESSNRVLLSYGYWQRRFGSDPAVIGQRLTVDGRARIIAGVLPSEAQLLGPGFVGGGQPLDVVTVVELSTYAKVEHHAQHLFTAIARLANGATIEQARADLDRIESQLAAENSEIAGWTASVFFLTDDLSLGVKEPLMILLAASFLLLLISCINVANLLLVRGTARIRETAVRQALGASRGTLVAQFVVEAVVLAMVGALLGTGVAAMIIEAMKKMIPDGVIARIHEIGIDGRVIAFTIVTSLLTALLFGVWPALRTARLGGLVPELRNRAPAGAGSLSRRTLVIAEVALAFVLVVCTGLVAQSVHRMLMIDPGFRADHVVTASISLGAKYSDSAAVGFYRALTTRLERQPGIEAAGATDTPPLTGVGIRTSIRLIGEAPRPADRPLISTIRSITPGYFRALGIDILRGRDVKWDEPTAMVVSRSAADLFWGGPSRSPLARQIAFNVSPQRHPVVGEVNDTREVSLATSPEPIVYVSMRRYAKLFRTMTLIVRGRGSEAGLVSTVRGVLRDIDPTLALYNVQTMRSIVDQSTAQQRLDMVLLAMFAGAATMLATLGIYGVVSYAVTQRRQELGVRLTLGAGHGDILQLVVGEGFVLGTMGVAIGVTASLAVTRLLQSWLFEIGRTDPLTFVSSAALLLGIALIASYVPARRAVRVDPLVSLRTE